MLGSDNSIKIPEILYYSYYTLGAAEVSPYHSHSYYEFTYLYECSGTYVVDGKNIEVKNGDIILFPPGCKHGELIAEGQQMNLFVIGFEGVDFSEIPAFYENFGIKTPFLDTGDFKPQIISCCEEIRKEILNSTIGYRYVVKGLIEKIYILLLRSKTKENKNMLMEEKKQVCIDYSDRKDIVAKIKYYIDFFYSSKISLEDIAHNVYLSPVYVIKLFKEEVGETPINYLIKVRVSKAIEFLEDGELNLEEISQRVGYSDVVHFSKIFKKYTGVSPKKYRNSGTVTNN